MPAAVAGDRLEQPGPLPVTQGMRAEARALRRVRDCEAGVHPVHHRA
jgi:hypothetical protein